MNTLLIPIDEETRKQVDALTRAAGKPETEVLQDVVKAGLKAYEPPSNILTEGIAKRKTIDTSGKKTLQKLFAIKATGGDDPYLSENIDHYLYGAPKKRP